MSKREAGAGSRAAAARCVDSVLCHGRSIDAALEESIGENCSDRDRSLILALAYGTLRTHLRNVALLGQLLDKPLKKKDSIVEALLSVGLFALTESRRPGYAVVSATVSAADQLGRKHLRGLVNAILRRFLREKDALLESLSSVEATTCHPQWLVEQYRKDWPDSWESIVAAGNRQPPMWVRVNVGHLTPNDWQQQCALNDVSVTSPHTELPQACLLAEPSSVADLPGFRQGDCSVQDIAAQLAGVFLQPEPGQRILDACAAPGGKTGHLLELCPDAELVALDMSAERLERVEENLERLNLRAQVICGDACKPDEWWDGELFDRILVDAPCSATGVIRRHPDIRFLRRPTDIKQLVRTQQTMLEKLWPLLKPGGLLLYSTCSVLRAENEAVVDAFLAVHTDAVEAELPKLVNEYAEQTAHGLQLLPGRFDNDGFYYALLASRGP
jgi:16S rRNA (cytosine967-C5)-methyltransferase